MSQFRSKTFSRNLCEKYHVKSTTLHYHTHHPETKFKRGPDRSFLYLCRMIYKVSYSIEWITIFEQATIIRDTERILAILAMLWMGGSWPIAAFYQSSAAPIPFCDRFHRNGFCLVWQAASPLKSLWILGRREPFSLVRRKLLAFQ